MTTKMNRKEGPFIDSPERIVSSREYRFICVGDQFGFEEVQFSTTTRAHADISRELKLNHGKTTDGKKFIVTDGGKMIAFADHIELTPDWTGSTQVKAMIGFTYTQSNAEQAYDDIQISVRKETAQKLANLLHKPVMMKYQSVVLYSALQEFTFTPA